MKYKILGLIALLVCYFILITPAKEVAGTQTVEPTEISILLGNQKIKMQQPIYLINGNTYVAIRELGEALGYPVSWKGDTNEVQLDIYHKELNYDKEKKDNMSLEKGVIPNEATARAVATTILEACSGKQLEYQDGNYEGYLHVSFYEQSNCWIISQKVKYKGEFFYATSAMGTYVYLNKTTGEVMAIGLDPLCEEATEKHKDEGYL